MSDRDLSNGAPPIPGMGLIQCRKADKITAARALKAALQLARFAAEL